MTRPKYMDKKILKKVALMRCTGKSSRLIALELDYAEVHIRKRYFKKLNSMNEDEVINLIKHNKLKQEK